MKNEEVSVEINYDRRYNLGNFNHKEYTVKLAGTESQLREQLTARRESLIAFIEELEDVVEFAHEANILKAKARKAAEDAEFIRKAQEEAAKVADKK